MDRITRRKLLEGATAIGVTAVAGCVAQPEDASKGSPDRTDGPNPEDDDGTAAPDSDDETTNPGDRTSRDDASGEVITDVAGIDDASIETVDTGCRTSEDEDENIGVDFDDEVITITGTLLPQNPCHEATLRSVTLESNKLSVGIDVRSTAGTDTMCPTCLGAISYETQIDPVDPSAITTVIVNHVHGDETTITR